MCPQGYVYRGRRDRMVKRRGYRIELGEIERGLYQHRAILEAGVVDAPDEASGVPHRGVPLARARRRPSIIEMKSFCAARLPSYMSPDVFLFLDALPRTSTDKVDYQRLARLAEPACMPSKAELMSMVLRTATELSGSPSSPQSSAPRDRWRRRTRRRRSGTCGSTR